MNDIARRLRAEAAAIPSTADPGLAGRIRDRLPAGMPAARPPLRFPIRLAVAASLAAAIALAWALAGREAPLPAAPMVVHPPTPPTLSDMLDGAGASLPGTVDSELAALGADFAAVARTVRSAVPF